MRTKKFKPGDRVEVQWDRHGWLPATFESYTSSGDPKENFQRIRAQMDNDFACQACGYHPDCVRRAA